MRSSSAADLVRRDADVEACLALLREGSKSFHAASLLLPPELRGPVAAVYGFCRVSDDAVDRDRDPRGSLARMRERLDAVYAARPEPHPVDRALAVVVREHGLPKVAFDWLLEGFAWDVEGRRYETLADLRAYCVRVTSTVGVVMAVLLTGERRAQVLARACDLGLAMQLTNVARDVGEDAREGRVYLPLAWLRELGVDVEGFVRAPRFSREIGLAVRRLLAEADVYYRRADLGVPLLPRSARLAIAAARRMYSDIGRVVMDNGYDSVSMRAHTSAGDKLAHLARSTSALFSRAEPAFVSVADEAAPLVAAVVREIPPSFDRPSVPSSPP